MFQVVSDNIVTFVLFAAADWSSVHSHAREVSQH